MNGLWPLPSGHTAESAAHKNPGGTWPLPTDGGGGVLFSPTKNTTPQLVTYHTSYTSGLGPNEAEGRLQTLPGGDGEPHLSTYMPMSGLYKGKTTREPRVLGHLEPGTISDPSFLPTYTPPGVLPTETYVPGSRPQHTGPGYLYPMPGDSFSTNHTELHSGVLSEIPAGVQALSARAPPIDGWGGLWPLPNTTSGQPTASKSSFDIPRQFNHFRALDL